jgi:hypothetical protein
LQTGVPRLVLDGGGDVGRPELGDEQPVERGHRHAVGGHRDAGQPVGRRERLERRAQLRAGDRALAVEGVVVEVVHDAGDPHRVLLSEVPGAERGGSRGRDGG